MRKKPKNIDKNTTFNMDRREFSWQVRRWRLRRCFRASPSARSPINSLGRFHDGSWARWKSRLSDWAA